MRQVYTWPLLAVLMATWVGCSGNKTDGGNFAGTKVSGTVKLDGKPVDAGIITVMDDKGHSCSTQIEDGGTFTLNNAPIGKVYVGVNTMAVKGQAMMNNANMKGKSRERIVDVPAKYLEPKQSGIVKEIEAGKSLDIELKK